MTKSAGRAWIIALTTIGVVLHGSCLGIATYVWYHYPPRPFMEDGPFHGRPVTELPTRVPDQVFPIFNGHALEVFDPLIDGESPIVLLRHQQGHIKWAVYADAYEQGEVKRIRFHRYERPIGRSGEVIGRVQWSYGDQPSWWYITANGDLRDYWYSW